jgi:hypothetical protein
MKKRILFVMLVTVCAVIVSIVYAQIFPTGMISYWKLDEGIDYVVKDLVGDNHGMIYGATWTAGKVDGALSFDGYNDYVRIPNSNCYNFTEAVTAEVWVRPNGNPGHYQMLLEKGTWAGNASWFFFGHRYTGYLNYIFGIGIPGGINYASAPMIGNLEDKAWSHLVGTYDRQNIKIYVNGVLNNQVAWTEPIRLNPYDLYISYDPQGWYFKGDVDEVAIYDRALTACEIFQHYSNGLAGKGYTLENPVETLIINIENFELPKGTENSLTSKLDNVLAALAKGNDKAAINMLDAFINAVEAQSGKKLSYEQADALITAAQCIIENILRR